MLARRLSKVILGSVKDLKDRFVQDLKKKAQNLQKKREKAWAGLSILVFVDANKPHSVRINYYILAFILLILIALPVAGAGSAVLSTLEKRGSGDEIEKRRIMLNSVHYLLKERRQLMQKNQELIRRFHNLSWKNDKSLDRLLKERVNLKSDHYEAPASRFEQDVLTLKRFRRNAPVLFEDAAYHALGMVWHRVYYQWILPRGRPLQPGVGGITSMYGPRPNPFNKAGEGEFHNGVDFAAEVGTPLIATAPGVVVYAQHNPRAGFGKHIRIHHGFGIQTLFAHCDELFVHEGDRVERGQVVGTLGRTGRTTGAHIHYEVRYGIEKPVDPMPYVKLK